MLKRFKRFLIAILPGLLVFHALHGVPALAQAAIVPPAPQFLQETAGEWQFEQGDWILVNVAQNTLHFVRDDYKAISSPISVATGKIMPPGKKFHYLGMAYDPRTPEETWEIRSKHQQNWYNVFGSKQAREQLFLRLYRVRGKQRIRSYYGFHTTPLIEGALTLNDGYNSWGCVLTRYDMLKRVEELYHLNNQVVKVITTYKSPAAAVAKMKHWEAI